MILRFVVDLAVPFTNNQAERDVRPVKIQQRTSGGCWRTLAGLADFAVVQSYLSTATQMGPGQLRRPHPTVHHRRLATTGRPPRLNRCPRPPILTTICEQIASVGRVGVGSAASTMTPSRAIGSS